MKLTILIIVSTILRRKYLVSNNTISTVSKFIKCEIYYQKITTQLINERHVVSSYLCTHISYLLGFNTDDEILFDTKYYFYT